MHVASYRFRTRQTFLIPFLFCYFNIVYCYSAGPSSQPQPPAGCASGHNYRRRTDLMPTIPNRDSQQTRKPFTRSPGRAYSMSRLDQLAKPRKKPIITADLPAVHEVTSSRPLSRQSQKHSVSRSMSHLAVGNSKNAPSPSQRPLRKSDSRSMHQLSATAPVPPPRPTRATQLRQQKLAAATANNGTSDGMSWCKGGGHVALISGENHSLFSHFTFFLTGGGSLVDNNFAIVFSIFFSRFYGFLNNNTTLTPQLTYSFIKTWEFSQSAKFKFDKQLCYVAAAINTPPNPSDQHCHYGNYARDIKKTRNK